MLVEYIKLGLDHILDLQAYDHIIFVVVLCALYNSSEWKKIILLVTAFTIGHSLTLALSVLNLININAYLVEILIPITIIITGINNIYIVANKHITQNRVLINYLIALCFGLIHGLGFSVYFKALMGTTQSIIIPLFAFNLGVEIGQVMIVFMVFVFLCVCLFLLTA